jgi:hypothetical protein
MLELISMDIKAFTEIADYLAGGGTAAVICILVVIIALLLLDRRTIVKALMTSNTLVIDSKDKEILSIKEINDKYHGDTMLTINALNELKIVLSTLSRNIK